MAALQKGPVAIGIDAASTPFALYKKGILDTPECGKQIDHAVLLVGYGTGTQGAERGKKYWKVKNSWAKDWGEQGYFRIARGKDMCAVADGALYPIGAAAAPAQKTPTPATTQCPAIAPAPPRLPQAYSVNVTQTWGDPRYPDSGIVAVSNGMKKMRNSGYMMLDETQLWRCDEKNSKPLITGHTYDIKTSGKRQKCVTDPSGVPIMMCPWSRWGDEIMQQLISAKPASPGTVPCPPNPYSTTDVLDGRRCHKYVNGGDAQLTTEYWLTVDGVPVKENQHMPGKTGFTVTTFYSDWKEGEPPASLFVVPSACRKTKDQEAPSLSTALQDAPNDPRVAVRDQLRDALRQRASAQQLHPQ